MGASQSRSETDTSSITLECGEDGETKILKRNLSQEELNELNDLLQDEAGDVTIDQSVIYAIAADMGLPIAEEEEEEEEEEVMFFVDPIETSEDVSLMPGWGYPLELPSEADADTPAMEAESLKPEIVESADPEPEIVESADPEPEIQDIPELSNVEVESLELVTFEPVTTVTVEEPVIVEPAIVETPEIVEEPIKIAEPITLEPTEPVLLEKPALVEEPAVVQEPAVVEVVEAVPVIMEPVVAEPDTVVEEVIEEPVEVVNTAEHVVEEAAPPGPDATSLATGIMSYIAKAFTTPKEEPEVEETAPKETAPKETAPKETAPTVEETAPVPEEEEELPRNEKLAHSLFGQFKKQEVEKIIMEAKLEGARSQAKLDADVMTSTLNVERSRWRARFSVIEDNLQKRKKEISSAHEEGTQLISSKLSLPKPKESCCSKALVDCYTSNPDQVLRCKDAVQSFDSCVSNALKSR